MEEEEEEEEGMCGRVEGRGETSGEVGQAGSKVGVKSDAEPALHRN